MLLVSSKHHFESCMATSMTATVYMCRKWPWICTFCLKHLQVHSSIMTYHRLVTRLTRRLSLVKRELPTLPEHLNGVRFARSFSVVFCGSLFVLLSFTFGHYVVCPSIYGLWLPLWYLQSLLLLYTTVATSVAGSIYSSGAPEFPIGVYWGSRCSSVSFFMVFYGSLLCVCSFSFDHCVGCPSIYECWLSLWYFQALLNYT